MAPVPPGWFSSMSRTPVVPACCTQLLALVLAQSNRATTSGSEELTTGSAGADGATAASSTLTQPVGAEPMVRVSRSPGATRILGRVYFA